eukprot:scaffold91680_cov107-Phaeocystis_antarctica.AAC.3
MRDRLHHTICWYEPSHAGRPQCGAAPLCEVHHRGLPDAASPRDKHGDAKGPLRGPGFSAAGVRLGRADVGFRVPPVGSIPEVSAHRRKLMVGGGLTTCQEAVVSQQCKTILPPSAPPTVPQSPPSPPLAPGADEPCTDSTQDDRCKVTLKIKARLLPCDPMHTPTHQCAPDGGTQKMLSVRRSTSRRSALHTKTRCA